MAMELKHLNPQHVMDVTGKAIDEISRLRAENAELKAKNAQLEDDVAFWKKKLSSCLNGDCILTCDTVEKYGKENVRLKRALWLLNAEVFKWKALYFWYGYTDKHKNKRYSDAESKCRAMAEKFK